LIGCELARCLVHSNDETVRLELLPYLSPSVLAGEKPTPADDVYGLAVILLELATATPARFLRSGFFKAELETVRSADGQVLSDCWIALLRRGLGFGTDPIKTVPEWSVELLACSRSLPLAASQKSIAFLVQRLFAAECSLPMRPPERAGVVIPPGGLGSTFFS